MPLQELPDDVIDRLAQLARAFLERTTYATVTAPEFWNVMTIPTDLGIDRLERLTRAALSRRLLSFSHPLSPSLPPSRLPSLPNVALRGKYARTHARSLYRYFEDDKCTQVDIRAVSKGRHLSIAPIRLR